jgi:hypothetical protein
MYSDAHCLSGQRTWQNISEFQASTAEKLQAVLGAGVLGFTLVRKRQVPV